MVGSGRERERGSSWKPCCAGKCGPVGVCESAWETRCIPTSQLREMFSLRNRMLGVIKITLGCLQCLQLGKYNSATFALGLGMFCFLFGDVSKYVKRDEAVRYSLEGDPQVV